jgi:MarR family 2-MHQ and catechol resistance regulon transcriptional repressor
LEKEGFVRRIHSKEDRRVILAELTATGKTKIDSVMPQYIENMSTLTSILSDHEQKELTKLLGKLQA